MFILKYIMIVFITTFVIMANAIVQPYSSDMLANSQKYVVYAYLASRIYDEGQSTVGNVGNIYGETWKLVRFDSGLNGFQAGIYKNTITKKYVAAIGGTTANPKGIGSGKIKGSLLDVTTDLQLISNLVPSSQSKSALTFINNRVVEENNRNIVISIDAIVGHSLGGGLAAYAGLYSGIKAITFNTSPIPFTRVSVKPMLDNHALTIVSKNKDGKVTRYSFIHEDKVTNIMSNNDPVSNVSFLLERTDTEYYSEYLPLDHVTPKGRWNFIKQYILAIPGRLHLDYATVGKYVWLPIDTWHGMDIMLEKMKDAKDIDDHNTYMQKWKYVGEKLQVLQRNGYKVTYLVTQHLGDSVVIDDYYPTEKASMDTAITDMRTLYGKAKGVWTKSNINFINFLGLEDEIDMAKTLQEELNNEYTQKYDNCISYKEYMLIAEATYKKLFGGPSFFSNLRRNNKNYLIYDAKRASYASEEMRKIYGHIFSLHFMAGTPKKYLQNDSQDINNGFVINFFDRFLDVVIENKSKIK